MTYTAEPRIDAYIDALPVWQQAICREVRELIHAADPDVTETIKRTNRPYFVLQSNICALLAAKNHVNIFLYDGAVAVRQGETINRPALTAMFKPILRTIAPAAGAR